MREPVVPASIGSGKAGWKPAPRRRTAIPRRKPPPAPPEPRPPLWTLERAAALALGLLFFVLGYLLPGPKPWTTREVLTFVALPVVCVWSPGLAQFIDHVTTPGPRRYYPVAFFRWFGWAALVLVNGAHQYQRWAG